MKKILSFLMLLTLLVMTGCGGKEQATETKFKGTGEGYLGDITVEVEIAGNTIKNIDILEHTDTPEIAEVAFDTLTQDIIARQTLDIDGMSGATYSSAGFIDAVAMAVDESEANLTEVAVNNEGAKVDDTTTDIIVIGGGGAGLTAAIEAAEKGADVILIEKVPILGGNTTYATGGLNASETVYQNNADTNEAFIQDTMKGGGDLNDESLVVTLVNGSSDIVNWLTERGADLSNVGRMGGASFDRTHRPTGGAKVGPNLIEALSNKAKELNVDIRLLTQANDILVDENNKITGIAVEGGGDSYIISADAIILATGGFGNSSEKFEALDPSLKGFGTTNHPGATGDALDLVAHLNVATVDMNEIQTHPTVVPVRNTMITEAVRGNGAILINREGNRFVSELDTRDVVSEATLEQDGKTAYLLFDQGVRESLKAIEGYASMGLLTESDSIDGLATLLKVPAKNLEDTMTVYNTSVENELDENFARRSLPRTLSNPPYYAIEVGPAVHHTMGGLKIDEKAQVYDNDGNVVDGLFAAGEVTGGIHGGNRLGGNALTDITVFGRIAGDSATEYIK